ncbi:MAG: hypothetical protein KAU41_03310 [Deltaproteobacteria bacterium]|jgi:hypothetical protein|nr:hypothetical protein [Deltaproteobacteria bacterium]
MKGREIAIGAIFAVMFFIGLLFVPLGMCNDSAVEEWTQPDASNAEVITAPISSDNAIKELEEWIQDHTVKVTLTTTCKYDGENLLTNEVYTGKELEERFEVEQLTKEFKIPVESQVIRMQKGEEKISVREKEKLITHWNEPLPWWNKYDYPQWTWSPYLDPLNPIPTVWAISADPINLAWENTNIDRVKDEILLEDPDWVTIYSPIQQHEHYVYDVYDRELGDGKWIPGEGVANAPLGLSGRYHARLWQMFYGDVVANAHHDCPPINFPFGHEADQYEEAERLITSFFIGPDDKEWTWYVDSYGLSLI